MVTSIDMSLFLKVLSYSLLPAAVMIIGGIIAARRTPGARVRSGILHFAAGVVFSVVAVELLPDVVRGHAPWEVAFGFGLGVAVMLGVQGLERKTGDKDTSGLPMGLLVGIGVDIAVDGLVLGIGFAAGAKEGLLLTLALTGEFLSLGLAASAELGQAGMPRSKAVMTISSLALLFVVCAAGGATLLHSLPHSALEIVLAFGVAALLFLVTEELLVEAHEEAETPLLTAMFFGGFLLFLLLGMMV